MSERGSILPLVAGAVLLGIVMVLGVSAATSLLIERGRLFALADSAAVVAAESFDPERVTNTASGVQVRMTSAEVRAHTVSYLQAVGEGSLTGVVVERAVSVNGRTVEVTLSSLWQPPVLSQFFPSSMRIAVSARAQVFIR
jgi:acyl-coenzyme A thioesterase PaaI-like protein